MKFKLEIKMDNAAFKDGNELYELARILKKVTEQIENNNSSMSVLEIKGNVVGQYNIKGV